MLRFYRSLQLLLIIFTLSTLPPAVLADCPCITVINNTNTEYFFDVCWVYGVLPQYGSCSVGDVGPNSSECIINGVNPCARSLDLYDGSGGLLGSCDLATSPCTIPGVGTLTVTECTITLDP